MLKEEKPRNTLVRTKDIANSLVSYFKNRDLEARIVGSSYSGKSHYVQVKIKTNLIKIRISDHYSNKVGIGKFNIVVGKVPFTLPFRTSTRKHYYSPKMFQFLYDDLIMIYSEETRYKLKSKQEIKYEQTHK